MTTLEKQWEELRWHLQALKESRHKDKAYIKSVEVKLRQLAKQMSEETQDV